MARQDNIDHSGEPYFVTGRDVGNTQRQVVTGAPVKIYRAASQSFGKDVTVEYVERPNAGGWVPGEDELADIENSAASGFARYAEVYGEEYQDQAMYPIERITGPPSPMEEKRILEAAAADQGLMGRRVQRDPFTRVPENVAEVDRMSESDKLYGKDKIVQETDAVLERMEHVDSGREGVDYKTSKAVPIKIIRS